MKRLTLIVLLSCTTSPLLASQSKTALCSILTPLDMTFNSGEADDKMKTLFQCGTSTPLGVTLNSTKELSTSPEDATKMKTLFQCGVGTERGFEGWMLSGLSDETITYFEKDHIEFFQHNPGNYSIGFEKKIEDMIGYTDLRIAATIDAMENCVINYATVYVSKDGKDWCPLNDDVRNSADFYAEKMEFMFIKIVADITFFQQGRFRMNNAVVYGNYKVRKCKPEFNLTEMSATASGPAANQLKEEFFVFSYDKNINIETENQDDYEFVLSNLLGQVILKEKSQGSRRFETDVPDGIYFVTIIQDDKLITTKKVVL